MTCSLCRTPIVPEERIVTFSSGVVSSPAPRYGLIWLSALKALAYRMMRGVRIKGEKGACNALSHNQAACDDVQFIINRLEHGAEHCYKAIARLSGQMEPLDVTEVADGGDAGAIMFAGALLAEHEARKLRLCPFCRHAAHHENVCGFNVDPDRPACLCTSTTVSAKFTSATTNDDLCGEHASDVARTSNLPTCRLPKGHKGRHSAPRQDGGIVW